MSANNVVVIDIDNDRRGVLSTLVEFINCQPVIVEEPELWFEDVGDLSDIAMVIVGDCGDKQQTKQVLRDLVNNEAHIPVFQLEFPDSDIADFPGALGLLRFPVKYPQLSNALQQATIFRGQRESSSQKQAYDFRKLVGNSRLMKAVQKMIDQVSDSEANVLILGESGTGKEVVARNLHHLHIGRQIRLCRLTVGPFRQDY
jgi:sigma-54 specific flagellar transcriptional regulator A